MTTTAMMITMTKMTMTMTIDGLSKRCTAAVRDSRALGAQRTRAELKRSPWEQACYSLDPMRVLLVEDYMPLRESVTQALEEAGLAVDASADGEEGLWYARSSDYDAIVLDIVLPKPRRVVCSADNSVRQAAEHRSCS
jgi:PleD family two-component response regulator